MVLEPDEDQIIFFYIKCRKFKIERKRTLFFTRLFAECLDALVTMSKHSVRKDWTVLNV